MLTTHADVATQNAVKYLTQLSKHWRHRFPDLTYSADRADIPLPGGPCILEARDGSLAITVRSSSESDLARMEQVVAEHLQRFAHREPLDIVWSREDA